MSHCACSGLTGPGVEGDSVLSYFLLIYFISFLMLILKNMYYLFLAALGLHRCTWVFSSCGEQRLLFIMEHRPWDVVGSAVVAHGLQLPCGKWDLPGPGIHGTGVLCIARWILFFFFFFLVFIYFY